MKINLYLNDDDETALREMANEANLPVEFIIRVACYNLISLWMRDRGKITPMDAMAPEVNE